ncbi:hypothetical protein DRN69_03150 [Candidatus Pacearchaeota archaeon]|nr:MAG: hypothetical protein DRN69_03150 [Candidatus Pacearchaeota archaeon]
MIWLPILGALGLATGIILQKTILKKKNINIKLYHVLEFLALVGVMLPFIYFFWKLEPGAFELRNIFIFFLVVLFSIIANLFVFYSMKWEKVSNLEPAKILEPLFTIILALIFSFIFGQALYNRKINVLIPALIAGAALIFSHIKKNHLQFNKYFIAAILGSFFFALELIISKLILHYYSPLTFYFLRCSAILLISFALFRPRIKKASNVKWHVLSVGIVFVIYRVIVYYGYLNYGVIFTTLMLMLAPTFVYLLAWKFLKEKPSWKNILATIIIVGCVVYVLLS